MNELRIIFEGIMAIGPPPRSTTEPDVAPGPLFVVMPRVTRHESRYSKFNKPDPRLYIPAHLPVIFTNLKALPGSRKEDDQIGDYYLWYPVRERMELGFSPSADPDNLQYIHPGPITGGPTYDIDKVADMRKIWPERSHVRKGMLRKQPPVSETVTCQVFVPSGRIGSQGEFLKKTARRAIFLPKKTMNPIDQELLPHVVVTVTTEQVDFEMYSLDTGEQLDSIRFRATNPQEPNEIRIVNGDPSNIRYVIDGLMGSHQEPSGIKPKLQQVLNGVKQDAFGDIDFECGYDVLDGYEDDDGKEVPIPWAEFAAGESNCGTLIAEPPKSGG